MQEVRFSTSIWAGIVAVTLFLGGLFTLLQLPAAWILAAIVAAGGAALTVGRELQVDRRVQTFARGTVGVIAALPLTTTSPATLASFLLPGLVVAAVTLGIGVVGGVLLAHFQRGITPETGILSMLAGGASMMPMLAQEVGADFRYVTLSQYLRLLAVMFSLPPIVSWLGLPHAGEIGDHGGGVLGAYQGWTAGLGPLPWWGLVVILAIIVVSAPLARRLRLPAPGILGPILLTVVVSKLPIWPDGLVLQPPTPMRLLAFCVVGWLAGGALSVRALRSFAKLVPATVLFIVILMAGCAATAGLVTWWLGVPYLDAYLATTPGGLDTVLLLSSEANSGPVVATMQIIRLIGVLVLAGWLPQAIRWGARLLSRGGA